MRIARTVAQLTAALDNLRFGGRSVGLVPTMGALHQGHMSLVEQARQNNDVVVVSVFVNPTQFNNPDDLRTYPRTEEADIRLLEKGGVDIAFIPSPEEIYPEPDTRVFALGEVAEVMEGPQRPGHFNGVAQVVSRLFSLTHPTRAYFGEKDFQQIAVIRSMCRLLDYAPEIVAVPICRGEDGLALSSRNVRLTPEHRAAAPGIYAALRRSLEGYSSKNPRQVEAEVTKEVNAIEGAEVEYYTIVDAETLQPAENWSRPAQGCITVWMGDVRLIDNVNYPSKQ